MNRELNYLKRVEIVEMEPILCSQIWLYRYKFLQGSNRACLAVMSPWFKLIRVFIVCDFFIFQETLPYAGTVELESRWGGRGVWCLEADNVPRVLKYFLRWMKKIKMFFFYISCRRCTSGGARGEILALLNVGSVSRTFSQKFNNWTHIHRPLMLKWSMCHFFQNWNFYFFRFSDSNYIY